MDGSANKTLPGPFPFLRAHESGVLVTLKVQPRASRNEIGGLTGEELKVKVTAPPVDAAANEALIRLLAETWDLPRNRVELLRGHTSRHKVVKVHNCTVEQLAERIR